MIKIEHFTFNAFQTCCSVVWDKDGNCAFVDPGNHSERETEEIISFVRTTGLKPACIMLTHCHFDHIYGMSALVRKFDIPVYAHKDEAYTLTNTNPMVCKAFGLPLPETFPILDANGKEITSDRYIAVSDGDVVNVGELRFEVIETPGHTKGGVCFYERSEKTLFCGDTLFAGAIGRTDHPGGDYDTLMRSIFEKLLHLDGETAVIPGHGPSTDIATERMTNPFLMPFNEPYDE